MGASQSVTKTRCDANAGATGGASTPPADETFVKDSHIKDMPYQPPPEMFRHKSFDERIYEKFSKQPLVPIGCIATAYFLVSGIQSFKNRDPRRAQKMMRARVGAQFATLLAFVGYMGFEQVNFDVAPAYFQAKDAEVAYKKKLEEEQKATPQPQAEE